MRSLAVLLLLAVAACDGSSNIVQPDRPLPISVRLLGPEPGAADTIRSVTPNGQTVIVVGRIGTPNPCYELSAYRVDAPDVAKITVVATPKPAACVLTTGLFEYTLVSPASGCPHVVIDYHYADARIPDKRVYDQSWFCAID